MVNQYVLQPLSKINYGARGIEAILQNAEIVLNLVMYDQPMSRGMAWSPLIDQPEQVVRAQLMARLVDAMEKYEPRVQITDVQIDVNHMDGKYKPTIKVVIRDDEQSV